MVERQAVAVPAATARHLLVSHRSVVAASLLLRHGAEQGIHVADGGVGTWQGHGWRVD